MSAEEKCKMLSQLEIKFWNFIIQSAPKSYQTCMGVWILFFKNAEKTILVHSPLGEVTCQLCWIVAWFSMCRTQTGSDLRLLEAMSSAGSKPRSLGCQGGWSPSALTSSCVFTSIDVLYGAFSDRIQQSQVSILGIATLENAIAI